ncbi:MaoC family dehydratase [Mesotoga sp.]|uniref:MaoC family dehydratase n=1 Tax=Mesotoga sp. TaxID=2053577 RepID=UPI00345E137D
MKIFEKFGRYYEDFEVGDTIIHARTKTISESDNNYFCLLSMNHHPVHLNLAYASKTQHGKFLVVGPLIIGLTIGISSQEISGKAIKDLGFDFMKHTGPVFVGDTIRVESIILDKYSSETETNAGIVVIESRTYNQDNQEVLFLKRKVMVPKRIDLNLLQESGC